MKAIAQLDIIVRFYKENWDQDNEDRNGHAPAFYNSYMGHYFFIDIKAVY